MVKSSVIERLREHEPDLGLPGLSICASLGRPRRIFRGLRSDVNLRADFDISKRRTLVGMAHLENWLADLLGAKVDLSPADWMKEPVRQQLVRESVLAF